MRTHLRVTLAAILGLSAACLQPRATITGELHMGNGLKIGEVRQTSAVVWTRLTRWPEPRAAAIPFAQAPRSGDQLPKGATLVEMEGAMPGADGEVRVAYWLADRPTTRKETAWRSVAKADDHARNFLLEGLAPGRDYRVQVEGRRAGGYAECAVAGGFRTAPLADVRASVSFCVVTGQDYHRRDDPKRGHRIYGHMLALAPDFLVHTGDTIYYDKARPFATTVELARFKWNRMYGMPEQRAFHQYVSCYFLKDDHDTLKNDCWPGQRYGDISWERGLAIYREQLPVLDPAYRRVRWGRDLEVWFVEGREYRSPNRMVDGPTKTIWGAEQKRWVMATMRASDATWRVLISPTPIVGPDRVNKNDNHANVGFAHEGAELREFLASQKNTFVICGDRHWQYVSRDAKTGLREFSCGPTSDKHAGGFSARNQSDMHEYLAIRGGFLHAQLDQAEGSARLSVRHCDTMGRVVHEVVFEQD